MQQCKGETWQLVIVDRSCTALLKKALKNAICLLAKLFYTYVTVYKSRFQNIIKLNDKLKHNWYYFNFKPINSWPSPTKIKL